MADWIPAHTPPMFDAFFHILPIVLQCLRTCWSMTISVGTFFPTDTIKLQQSPNWQDRALDDDIQPIVIGFPILVFNPCPCCVFGNYRPINNRITTMATKHDDRTCLVLQPCNCPYVSSYQCTNFEHFITPSLTGVPRPPCSDSPRDPG